MGHQSIRKDDYHVDNEKKYTPEYRQEAARLVIDTGRPIAAVARELGVGAGLLGRWVKAESQRFGQIPVNELYTDERAELNRLHKKLAELKLDNEFLAKAAAFFASKLRR